MTDIKPSEKAEWQSITDFKGDKNTARIIFTDEMYLVYYWYDESGNWRNVCRVEKSHFIKAWEPIPQKKYVEWNDETRPKGPIVVISKNQSKDATIKYLTGEWFELIDGKWIPTTHTDGSLLKYKDIWHSNGTISPCGAEVVE